VQARRSYTWPFTQVSEVLGGADISIVNLENPVMNECPPSESDMVFCMPAAALEGLTFAGIDIATVANNHTYDQGSAGYTSTVDALNAVGIQPSGSESLVIVDRGETRFGFIGFNRIRQTAELPVPTTPEVIASIEAADKLVDVLIVSFHWGVEFTSEPIVDQRDLAHAAVRAGADVIIGHHPHVLQTIEEYRGVPIFYSLGNFVFDNMSGTIPRTGWIAMLEFSDHRLMSYHVIETMIYDFGQPRIEDVP
jgi:poly-gamma-glutamate capsule biosynthesis protein CapA/YwtB (metallophosphatase superfamily)